jgi:hypothetical protein
MTERKLGSEITFDGGTWGVVDFIDNTWTIVEGKQIGIIIVIDEDGGEHELTEARID